MSEQAQVGDTVRLTVTRTQEGEVYKNRAGDLCVENWQSATNERTIEVLARATNRGTDVPQKGSK